MCRVRVSETRSIPKVHGLGFTAAGGGGRDGWSDVGWVTGWVPGAGPGWM